MPLATPLLALVGWYLMVPPKPTGWEWWHGSPPLSQWDQLGAYASAEKCETAKVARELQDALAKSASLPAGALRATTLPDQDYQSEGKWFRAKGGYVYPKGGRSGAAALSDAVASRRRCDSWHVQKQSGLVRPQGRHVSPRRSLAPPPPERIADRLRCVETTDPRLAK